MGPLHPTNTGFDGSFSMDLPEDILVGDGVLHTMPEEVQTELESKEDQFLFEQDPYQKLPLSNFFRHEGAAHISDLQNETSMHLSTDAPLVFERSGVRQWEFEPHVVDDGASHSPLDLSKRQIEGQVVMQSYELVRRANEWLHRWGEHQSVCHHRTRKHVTFHDKVQVFCFHEEQTCAFEIDEDKHEWWLRNLWHLHGHIMSWDMLTFYSANFRSFCFPLQQMTHHEELGSGQLIEIHPPGFAARAAVFGDMHDAADVWGRCWMENMQYWRQHERVVMGRFIATWFLSRDHVHVCVQQRRVRIHDSMSASDFQQACRQTWQDHILFSDHELDFHFVHPKPPGLPSTLAHVIIVQGDQEHFNCVLYQGDTLPAMRRQRAVLFREGISVRDFFVEAQHPSACQVLRARCFIQHRRGHIGVLLNENEQMDVPKATFVSGEVRVVEEDIEEDGEISDEDVESLVTTNVPSSMHSLQGSEDIDVLSQDDERSTHVWSWERYGSGTQHGENNDVNLMSGSPVMMQFDHPDPYPWQIEPHLEHVEPEGEEIDTIFADQHQQQLQSMWIKLCRVWKQRIQFGKQSRMELGFWIWEGGISPSTL